MRRITISIPPADLEKIEKMADEKGLILSEYLRMLIRIGVTIEEATAQKNSDGEGMPPLNQEDQILLWKTQLSWQRETCFLVRHLVDILTQAGLSDRNALFENAQKKAQAQVQMLLPQLNGSSDESA